MGYPISIQMSYVTIILIGTRIIKVEKKPQKAGTLSHMEKWEENTVALREEFQKFQL